MSMQELEKLGLFFPGSRIGILLVHGLAGTPTELQSVGRHLNKYGFTVFCPLLAGHCTTESDLVATTWRDWAESASYAFERLYEHVDVLFVGGLSAGAVLALYLAGRYQEKVRGQVLYSTTLRYDGWSIPKARFLLPLVLHLPYIGRRYSFKETFPYGVKNEKLRQRIVAHMHSGNAAEAGLFGTPGTSLRELWRMVAVVKKDMPAISSPTLLIHARNDDIASLGNALEVQRQIGGEAGLMLLNDSYHLITIDQERHKVSKATAMFCNRLLSAKEQQILKAAASSRIPTESEAEDGGFAPPLPNVPERRTAVAV